MSEQNEGNKSDDITPNISNRPYSQYSSANETLYCSWLIMTLFSQLFRDILTAENFKPGPEPTLVDVGDDILGIFFNLLANHQAPARIDGDSGLELVSIIELYGCPAAKAILAFSLCTKKTTMMNNWEVFVIASHLNEPNLAVEALAAGIMFVERGWLPVHVIQATPLYVSCLINAIQLASDDAFSKRGEQNAKYSRGRPKPTSSEIADAFKTVMDEQKNV